MMKLIISYVLISTGKDIYIEQALMSIWSCRYYHRETEIVIVTDEKTSNLLNSYPEFRKLVNKITVANIDDKYSNFEKSRILKTKLRQLLKGDLLFVDTDTIFCGTIDEKDFTAKNISMVEDLHAANIAHHPFGFGIKRGIDRLYETDTQQETPYYNSGIIFYRDTPEAHKFSQEWFENWKKVKDKEGGRFDQPSLLYTLLHNPNIIEPLNSIYNVQVLGSVKYLYSGKILHFFNANWGRDSVHPFLDKKYYMTIKEKKKLVSQHKNDILNCKNLFSTTSFIIGPDDVQIWLSLEVDLLKRLWLSKLTRFSIRFFLRVMAKVITLKNGILNSIGKYRE